MAKPFVCGLAPDDYPKLSRDDERAKLVNAAYLLKSNPQSILVFVIYLAPNEPSASAKRRALFIRNFFEKDKIVASVALHVPFDRIHLLFANSEDRHTAVYVFTQVNLAPFAKAFKASSKVEDIRPVIR